jgi:hypothetical protein
MVYPRTNYESEARKLLHFAGHKFIDKPTAAKILGHTAGSGSNAFARKIKAMANLGLIEIGQNSKIRVCECVV